MELSEETKRLRQLLESKVPGLRIISISKNKLNVQFEFTYGKELSSVFTMELTVSNGIPSIGRNDLPVFMPATVVPRIKTSGICESLQVTSQLLEAYMSRKMQVEELQKQYGKLIVGRVQFTLPYTYVEFTLHIRNNGEGMLCLGFHYSLLETLPRSVKAQWKVARGAVKDIQEFFEEEIKVFMEKKLETAFPLVFQHNQ